MTTRGPEMANPPDAQRARYLARKEAGICVRNKEHGPAEPGHVLCAPCIIDSRYDRRESYRRNRRVEAAKGCTRCGGDDGHNARSCQNEPLPGWKPTDARRLERQRMYQARRREQGVCLDSATHEKPRPGKLRCDACMARRRGVKS